MVMNYQALLCESTEALQNCSDTPRLDAEILLCHLLGKERVWLAIHAQEYATEKICQQMRHFIARRSKKEPIAYIIGKREFMGLPFCVRSGVLIPRPDTETLVEAVLKENTIECPKIIDLCTGSGAIAVSLAHFLPNSIVSAVDFSDICIQTAQENAKKNGVSERVNVVYGDILSDCFMLKPSDFPKNKDDVAADILVSNPPYIRKSDLSSLMSDVRDYEPKSALDGGEDGLIFYHRIAALTPSLLKRGGLLAVEAGHDQAEEIAEIFTQHSLNNIHFIRDLSGIQRVVLARRE